MTKIYFSDTFGLQAQFLKLPQDSKGGMAVLLLMKWGSGRCPQVSRLVAGRNGPCD